MAVGVGVDSFRRGWRDALADRAVLVGAMVRASPGLSALALGVTVVSGAIPPAFNLTSGLVAGSVESAVQAGDRSLAGVAPSLALATVLYLAMHMLGPVRDGLGAALMRRVDTALTADVMQAMSRPRGVAHLEDPEVLDRIAQVEGAVNAMTPGAGAMYLIMVWVQRLQGSISLVIVATFSPPLAAALLVGHLVAYRWRRWHQREMTSALLGRIEGIRRSQYMHRLAVEPEAAKEARVFSLSRWFRGRYRQEYLAVMEEVWRRRRKGGLIAVAVSLGMFALEAGGLALVAQAAVRGDIGFGAAVAYAHVLIATSNLGQFSEAHLFVTDGAVAVRQLRNLEASVPAAGLVDPRGSRPADGLPRASIRFEHVRFAYPGAPDEVYADLDLEIEAGRSLAIVGQNGAGKTTLVKLLARLYDPTGGRITVDGHDLRDIDAASWQRQVAAIFQDFVPYKLSAADNVAFGALHVPRDTTALDRAADLAGAARLVRKLPHGWDTVLSRQFDGGTDLSGGEWQRLALARAVYAVHGGAVVLILDEPTAALDVRGEAEVYDRFLELTRGLTTIVVSHRFSTVRRADRVVVIEHGRVVEDGTHHSLLAAGGRYAVMYELQAARFREETDDTGSVAHA
ncbi:MAG TPA: ABC transporter ATP-binding protein [Acidimicrobiales bacterium]|jgi:ATP-binding cassette subfamily B protein